MVTLYIDNPHMREGSTTITQIELAQADDYDMWVSVTHMDLQDDTVYRHSNGRVRMVNGGGSSLHLHEELVQLMLAVEKDISVCGEFGTKPALRQMLKLQPRSYEERHLDDRHGYLGVKILAEGDVRLHMRPLDDTLALNDGCTPIDVIIPHSTPYQHAYEALERLWWAIHRDNANKKPMAYA